MAASTATWPEHAIWWQLHPISFTGAEPVALPAGAPPAHRLRRIEAWLDYLIELGCNGLALGPIFEGHRSLVALNHAQAAVQDYVTRVMTHWLERGADGWRLDAAYAVPPAFWRTVLGRVRARHPSAWFAGEMIHGDYRAMVRDGGLDTVTQYELWKAIWSGLNDRNFFELAWALDRHGSFARSFRPLTFVGNHDVTRLASRLTEPCHLGHALVVLFTVAGVPSVYAGDEQGFHGIKYERADGDAQIRPAFPDGPGGLPPQGWPVYRLHQDLIGMRRRNPWLVRSQVRVTHLEKEAVAYQAARCDGGPALAVLLNVSDAVKRFPLPGLGGKRLLASTGGDSRPAHVVEAHGWAVLDVQP